MRIYAKSWTYTGAANVGPRSILRALLVLALSKNRRQGVLLGCRRALDSTVASLESIRQ
jgi:hypothetical protein